SKPLVRLTEARQTISSLSVKKSLRQDCSITHEIQTWPEKIMGFRRNGGIINSIRMNARNHKFNCLVIALLLAALPFAGEAKSYSSGGGHSYSSHSSSSHSSSFSSGRSSSSSSSRSSGGSSTRSSSSGGS